MIRSIVNQIDRMSYGINVKSKEEKIIIYASYGAVFVPSKVIMIITRAGLPSKDLNSLLDALVHQFNDSNISKDKLKVQLFDEIAPEHEKQRINSRNQHSDDIYDFLKNYPFTKLLDTVSKICLVHILVFEKVALGDENARISFYYTSNPNARTLCLIKDGPDSTQIDSLIKIDVPPFPL